MLWRVRHRLAAPQPPIDAPLPSSAASAWPGWRDFRVLRRHFEDAAQTQCSFHLQPLDGAPLPTFKPGQYLTFALQLPSDAGAVAGPQSLLTRCYSLSDRPDPAEYRITVKRVPPPLGQAALPAGLSSTFFHDEVQVGDVLKVKAPAGHFYIDTDATTTTPAILIAGGIGITPMMSMLRWCLAQQPERVVQLYYGVRSSADHAFKQTLEALAQAHPAFKIHVVYSRPERDDVLGRGYQHLGYIDLPLLRMHLPPGRNQFYVCGPPPMMQSLVPALREWGVSKEDLHFEAFGPASMRPVLPMTNEPLPAASVALDIKFTRSGRSLVWDGRDANLLDFAERHGVAVDSGCRSGSCGTCATKLLAGRVDYAEPPDYDIASGACLLCVGKPASALVLEA
ncbi:FAD/NAD(P)-binding oxidoreductase [Paucibacter sp. KCTC 42545]|nr:FAD/NAD(P)-binding oxidoreductase [Paucibacter sp. KCTC 42545]